MYGGLGSTVYLPWLDSPYGVNTCERYPSRKGNKKAKEETHGEKRSTWYPYPIFNIIIV